MRVEALDALDACADDAEAQAWEERAGLAVRTLGE
jgi:hypothetical protein